MSPGIVSELASTGVLRAGINLSNFLLVTGRSATGDPQGVAPDLAGEIASRLGVPIKYVPFKSPGELADAAGTGVWDIGLIGAEPQRAEKIVFTAAYCEIEATYLVPAGRGLPARLYRRGEIIRASRQADRTPQCARPFGRTESQPPAPVVGRDLPQGNSIATF
ncbi:MAG: transporter substrate-binding domain-containing protein [Xanthobacteraceae bacterium]